MRQCKSLIIASSFSSMMKTMSLEAEWVREILWRHGFTTALLSMHLNRSLNVGFQGEEFAAGLIHDIGRMLLATCFPEQFPSIDPLDFDEGPETLDNEHGVIETNHCEVGVWFTLKNALPEPLVDVVRYHHCPEKSPRNRRLVALIAASDHMANHLQRFDEALGYDPVTNPSLHLLERCGVSNATRCFAQIASIVMESAKHDAVEIMTL
jgi:HD-like signal output (HDOD) protein